MTTRHGLCTISKNFNKNSGKIRWKCEKAAAAATTHTHRERNWREKKWQLQQPNMRILSCQSSLTGYTKTTTTRNENKLNASISNFDALFFVFEKIPFGVQTIESNALKILAHYAIIKEQKKEIKKRKKKIFNKFRISL